MRTGREMSNLNIAKSESLKLKCWLSMSYILLVEYQGVLGAENEDENVECGVMVSCMEERGVTCNKALPKVGGRPSLVRRPSQSGLETKSGSHLGDKQCFI